MTIDMMVEIARCDYGHNVPENLQKLKDICRTQKLESRLQWEPKEVLQLTRWSEPDEMTPNRSHGKRGHIIRAFCCVALLLAGADTANDGYIDGENETLAQALESCLYLGREYCQGLGELLSWRYPSLRDYDDFPLFVIFALIVLALNVRTKEISREQSALLVAKMTEEEIRLRGDEECPWIFNNRKFRSSFLGMETFDQMHKKWMYFASELLTNHSEHVEVADLAKLMLSDRHWANM